jgi:hypothetical protein
VADAERRRRNSGHVRLAAPTTELASSLCRQSRATDAGRSMDDTVRGRHGPPQGQVCTGRNRPLSAGWWSAEPDVGRVAHGVPARVDRLHGLGNAVVPQIPEILGRAVLTVNAMRKAAA